MRVDMVWMWTLQWKRRQNQQYHRGKRYRCECDTLEIAEVRTVELVFSWAQKQALHFSDINQWSRELRWQDLQHNLLMLQ